MSCEGEIKKEGGNPWVVPHSALDIKNTDQKLIYIYIYNQYILHKEDVWQNDFGQFGYITFLIVSGFVKLAISI